MNFITWNKAYCSFPAATLERRELYLVNSFGQGYTDESELLATDGIITMSVTCPSTTLSSYQNFFIALRRIGDKYTLVVDFNVQGVTPSKTPDGGIGSGAFKVYLWNEKMAMSL
jgi:hypothetical protein